MHVVNGTEAIRTKAGAYNHLQRIIAHPHQPLPLLHLLYLVYLLHLPPSLQLLQGRAYYMPFCSIFEHLYTYQGH